MSETIWKYPLPVPAGRWTHWMPDGAEVLCVQLQGGVPTLWAKVDPSHEEVKRTFLVVGTGNKMPDAAGRYVGTVQQPPFVWHVFEEADDA